MTSFFYAAHYILWSFNLKQRNQIDEIHAYYLVGSLMSLCGASVVARNCKGATRCDEETEHIELISRKIWKNHK